MKKEKKNFGWVTWCTALNLYVDFRSCSSSKDLKKATVFSTRKEARLHSYNCERVYKVSLINLGTPKAIIGRG